MGLFLPRGNDLPLSDHWVVFSGGGGYFFRSPGAGEIRMSSSYFWPFWGLWGFLLCS